MDPIQEMCAGNDGHFVLFFEVERRMLAQRLSAVAASPTIEVMTRALELKAAGADIISLAAGEPDFATPDHIQSAAARAIRDGLTKYTAVDGMPDLKEAVVRKFWRENDLTYTHDEVMVGSGAKQILYNALMATVNPGEDIVIPAPYWVSYPDIVRLTEGVPVLVECDRADGFKLKPAALRSALNEKSRWLILNSPCNPTGAVYSADELAAIATVLADYPHVWILTDDIYEHLRYGPGAKRFATIAQVAPELKSRTLTVNGVSKAYCMTGWRIGFGGGPRALIKAMAKLQSQSTSCPSAISQAAAKAALNGPKEFIATNNLLYAERRQIVVEKLNETPGLECDMPSGAFYAFPSCTEMYGTTAPDGSVISNDSDLVAYLLEAAGVAAVPGAAFGSPGHFRVSYTMESEMLETACERIQRACVELT